MPRQPITIDTQMAGGSWALARHIRRDAPWFAGGRIRGTIQTFFEAARTGAGVDVYVLDSGLRFSHEEFSGRAVSVGSVYSGTADDDHGHGTRVAGPIAGATTGFARGASLRIVKVLDDQNSTTGALVAEGLDIALADYLSRSGTNRPAVINLSLSVSVPQETDAAVTQCLNAGMVVVASAHNSRSSTILSPGNTRGVICAGGLRANDTPYYVGSSGTNYGPRVDILAAGERVWTSDWLADDAYRTATGTSASAAVVSGVVACMLEGRPRLRSWSQTQAVRAELLRLATVGRFVPQPHHGIGDVADRILYLDASTEPRKWP